MLLNPTLSFIFSPPMWSLPLSAATISTNDKECHIFQDTRLWGMSCVWRPKLADSLSMLPCAMGFCHKKFKDQSHCGVCIPASKTSYAVRSRWNILWDSLNTGDCEAMMSLKLMKRFEGTDHSLDIQPACCGLERYGAVWYRSRGWS